MTVRTFMKFTQKARHFSNGGREKFYIKIKTFYLAFPYAHFYKHTNFPVKAFAKQKLYLKKQQTLCELITCFNLKTPCKTQISEIS